MLLVMWHFSPVGTYDNLDSLKLTVGHNTMPCIVMLYMIASFATSCSASCRY